MPEQKSTIRSVAPPTRGGGAKKGRRCALTTAAVLAVVTATHWPSSVEAFTTLDPQDPLMNFQRDGNEAFIPGPVLTLIDATNADYIFFRAHDYDAVSGSAIDLVTTFQIQWFLTDFADAGNSIVINDGATRSAIAACVIKNGELGVGLLAQGEARDPNSYPVFVPVDWQAAPVTIRLRRHANGDAELIEINGVPPDPPAILPAAQCPGPTRAGSTVEFGCRSVPAQCHVEYAALRSETTAPSAVGLAPDGGRRTALLAPAPNPSRGAGPIQLWFRLDDPGSVQLEILDLAGRIVSKPPVQIRPAGTWSIPWNGRDREGRNVAAGVYWVRMSVESKEVGQQRFIVLR